MRRLIIFLVFLLKNAEIEATNLITNGKAEFVFLNEYCTMSQMAAIVDEDKDECLENSDEVLFKCSTTSTSTTTMTTTTTTEMTSTTSLTSSTSTSDESTTTSKLRTTSDISESTTSEFQTSSESDVSTTSAFQTSSESEVSTTSELQTSSEITESTTSHFQTSSEDDKSTTLELQTSSESEDSTISVFQTSSEPHDSTTLKIQTSSESKKSTSSDTNDLTTSESEDSTTSELQTSSESDDSTTSELQTSSKFEESTTSKFSTSSESSSPSEIQTTSESEEPTTSKFQTSSGSSSPSEIQTSSESEEPTSSEPDDLTTSELQTSSKSKESTTSKFQTSSEFDGTTSSKLQTSSELEESTSSELKTTSESEKSTSTSDFVTASEAEKPTTTSELKTTSNSGESTTTSKSNSTLNPEDLTTKRTIFESKSTTTPKLKTTSEAEEIRTTSELKTTSESPRLTSTSSSSYSASSTRVLFTKMSSESSPPPPSSSSSSPSSPSTASSSSPSPSSSSKTFPPTSTLSSSSSSFSTFDVLTSKKMMSTSTKISNYHPTTSNHSGSESDESTTSEFPEIIFQSSSQQSPVKIDEAARAEQSTTNNQLLSNDTSGTTTMNPCLIQCPDHYLIGSTTCFIILSPSTVKSYQSAVSNCRLVDHQDLISFEHLRNHDDLDLLNQNSIANNLTWHFANGGGSLMERFQKKINVFNISDLTPLTSPIASKIGISDWTTNISAICVKPQYCQNAVCHVKTALTIFGVDLKLTTEDETISAGQKTRVKCVFTNKTTKVSCSSRGVLVPSLSTIQCEPMTNSQILRNSTGEIVESCSKCFSRGTRSCTQTSEKNGAICNCRDEYEMSTCWLTKTKCEWNSCGNGTCMDQDSQSIVCHCNWGYEGEKCEKTKDEDSKKASNSLKRMLSTIDSTSLASAGLSLLTILKIISKLFSKVVISSDDDDPQDSHQTVRSVLFTMATTAMFFFKNPHFLMIPTPTCRMYFLIIHFLFTYTLTQWMFESYNVNQVVRYQHINKWETDTNDNGLLTNRAAPRFLMSTMIVGFILVMIYQYGWNQLISNWTCIGVICETTSSMWLPIFITIACLLLFTTAIFESTVLIQSRRPLLNQIIRQRIEHVEGILDGQNIEKCRCNVTFCFVSTWLLAANWIFLILSADKKDDKLIGAIAFGLSIAYGLLCCIQGIVTTPTTNLLATHFLMSKLPARLAPQFDSMKMWTRPEMLSISSLPKAEKQKMLDEHLPLNARLFLEFRWDNELKTRMESGEQTIDEALSTILREQVDRFELSQATDYQKEQVMETFADWVQNLETSSNLIFQTTVNAKFETVTIVAAGADGIAKLSDFFVEPGFGTFVPIIPTRNPGASSLSSDLNEFRRHFDAIQKRRRDDLVKIKENYSLVRDEVAAQSNFIKSAIHFRHFGKITE